MVLDAIFNNTSVISRLSVYLQRKPEYPVKTTDLPQVTIKLDHAMLYRMHIAISGNKTSTLVVISSDYIGSSC